VLFLNPFVCDFFEKFWEHLDFKSIYGMVSLKYHPCGCAVKSDDVVGSVRFCLTLLVFPLVSITNSFCT
jgi:hypothetical protein